MFGKEVIWDDKTSSIYFNSPEKEYRLGEKQNRKLSIEDFGFIRKGMSYKEVYEKVGPHAKDIGSGIFVLVYELEDGASIRLHFTGINLYKDCKLYSAYIVYEDGSEVCIL